MPLHSTTDPHVDALLALLAGGLNAELAADVGEDVVVGTYPHPIALGGSIIPQTRLPALAVWRLDDQHVRRGAHRPESLTTFRIDYFQPATPPDLVARRWALLRSVWAECLLLLCAGHHEAVESDAAVLANAGFTEIVIGGRWPRAQYPTALASGEGTVYPHFFAEVRAQHADAVDISALPDVSLMTMPHPHDLEDDEEATFAAELHEGE